MKIRKAIRRQSYFVHIDSPISEVSDPYVLLMGVLVLPKGKKISSITISNKGKQQSKVLMHERPDIQDRFGDLELVGLSAVLSNSIDGEPLTYYLQVDLGSEQIDHKLDLTFSGSAFHAFEQSKKAKHKQIMSLLQCPHCAVELNPEGNCPSCDLNAGSNGLFDFRAQELAHALDRSMQGNISAHSYDEKALSLIDKHKDGLILDNGSGLRKTYYENVVNFEIENYLTTDVLGVGEALPFKDASFDAVFSLSVLEHVRDPFTCVSEILRVLKPGGELYVAVPFLQPFHGYPDHYYNMTSSGLKNLFHGKAEVSEVGVSEAGHPFHSLQWFLTNYSRGLSSSESENFGNLRIRDIISPTPRLKKQLLRHLDDSKREELASFNYLLAQKPK